MLSQKTLTGSVEAGKIKGILLLVLILPLTLVHSGCVGLAGSSSLPLSLSNPAPGSVSSTWAMVDWTTNVPATSQVEFGTTTNYGLNTAFDPTLVNSHAQALTALAAATTYHYRVHSKDAAGIEAVSGDFTLTTAAIPDTTPPTVTITLPAPAATVSGMVAVVATASDNVGVVGVQFKVDGNNTGAEVLAAPYAYSLNTTTLSNGSHSLTAVARDAAGNRTTSAAVSVNVNNAVVDTTPPTVSITSPAAGASVSGTISVSANASDNVGVVGVQFKVDGNNTGAEVLAAPYTYSLNTTTLSNASHSLTAVARDAAGNRTTSAAVSVNINNTVADTTPPTVSVTAPIAGATVSGSVSVSANASDNVGVVGVQFKVDGNNTGAEVLAAPYTYSLNTATLSNGSHSLTAVARDAAGNRGTSAPLTITVNNQVPPTISIISPGAGATVSGTVSVATSVSSNTVSVQFKLDGSNTGNLVTSAPFSYSLNTTSLSNSSHSLTAVASNAAAQTTTSAAVSINVNNVAPPTPPTISIISPASGATVSGTVSVSTNISTNTVSVQFQVDGSNTGNPVTSAPFSYSLNTTSLSNGSHSLTAVASNAAAQTTTSAAVSINVNNVAPPTPPTISIISPASGATVSGTVSVSTNISTNTVSVQFQVDGSNTGNPVTSAPFSYSLNTTSLSNGSHSLTAVASNAAAQTTTSAAVSINVNNVAPPTPPTISITSPASGATVSGTVSVSTSVSSNTVSVQFQVDGGNTGAPVTGAPFSYSLNTTSLSNGSHSLTAVASNAAAQTTTSAAVSINVNNVAPPTPPTISISSPAAGATVSGTISVSTSVSSNTVSVQFKLDGSNTGNLVTSAPFSYSLNTTSLSNSSHSLTAVASNAAAQTTTSAAVSINVNNVAPPTPPTISIISPASGATVSGTVSVSTNISTNTVSVQFQVDGSNTGNPVTSAPFSYSLNTTSLSNGSHSLTAVASNAAAQTTTSAAVSINVNNVAPPTPPTISISSPAAGATVSGTVSVSTSVSSNTVSVQFQVDGGNTGNPVTSAPFSYSLNTTSLSNGSHSLTAVASNAAAQTTTSAAVSINVNNVAPPTPPTISISSPAAGATVSG